MSFNPNFKVDKHELKIAHGISYDNARSISAKEKREEFMLKRAIKRQENHQNRRLAFAKEYGPDKIIYKRAHPSPYPKTNHEERILYLRNTREGSFTGPVKNYFLEKEYRLPTIY